MSMHFKNLKSLGTGAWKVISDRDGSAPINAKSKIRPAPRPRRDNNHVHDMLWSQVVLRWPHDVVRELEGAVPGRKFRIDIGFPSKKLAVEIDGWEFHGKFKGDFTRDRERQNLLTLNGWRIVRFTAGNIRKDVGACVEVIDAALRG